jgi:hypothetical protein
MDGPGSTAEGGGVAGMDVMGAAGSVLGAGQSIFGATGVDTSGAEKFDIKAHDKGRLAGGVGGAAKLGKGIATGNPMDMIAGVADIGGAIFGGGKAKKEMEDANSKYNIGEAAAIRQSDFANGGKMNSYANGSPNYADIFGLDPAAQKRLEYEAGYNNTVGASPMSRPDALPGINEVDETATGKRLRAGTNWLGENAGNIAQYAPVVGNLLALKNLEKPNTPRGTRLGGVYSPGKYDEAALTNQINQQNIERSLTESSGGDLGALRTNLQSAGLGKLKALGEGMRSQRGLNIAEEDKKFRYGQQKDTFNAQLDERYLDRKARDQGAYETAKAGLEKGVTDSIGNIGREEVDKKTVKQMFGYKWNGKYWIDPKTNVKYTNKQVSEKVDKEKAKQSETNSNMFGGYTKK